jgi:hypothetical protein
VSCHAWAASRSGMAELLDRSRFQLVTGDVDVLLTSKAYEGDDETIAANRSVGKAAAHGHII